MSKWEKFEEEMEISNDFFYLNVEKVRDGCVEVVMGVCESIPEPQFVKIVLDREEVKELKEFL